MKLYVFGPITGFSSYPMVMQGLVRAFKAHGLDPVEIDVSGTGGEAAHRFVLGLPPEDRQSNLVFAMKPEPQMKSLVTEHGMTLVGMHVGDVDRVPESWHFIMEHERFVVVPSTWMREVVALDKAVVSHHGISEEYLHAALTEPPLDGPFRLLHCCSSAAFPDRKGTPQVLEAFSRLAERGFVLTLVVPELRRTLRRLLDALETRVRSKIVVRVQPLGLPASEMIALYQSHHALLVPSRAEGFGCQPLEARALGLPVVQTLCTGLRDGLPATESPLAHGIVQVEHGPLAPAWGDFGRAPSVSSEAIESAILLCRESYPELLAASRRHVEDMKRWSWVSATSGLAMRLAKLAEEVNQ